MRTIEEIKEKILRIKSEPFELSRYDRIASLNVELIAAQDAEIARLRQQLVWKPIETHPSGDWPFLIGRFIGDVLDLVDICQSRNEPWMIETGYGGYTHWLSIPPLPQPQEGSPMDNTLTDEVYP